MSDVLSDDTCPQCGGSFAATGGKPTIPPIVCQKCWQVVWMSWAEERKDMTTPLTNEEVAMLPNLYMTTVLPDSTMEKRWPEAHMLRALARIDRDAALLSRCLRAFNAMQGTAAVAWQSDELQQVVADLRTAGVK